MPFAGRASLFQYCMTRLTGASTDARPMCYEQRCHRHPPNAKNTSSLMHVKEKSTATQSSVGGEMATSKPGRTIPLLRQVLKDLLRVASTGAQRSRLDSCVLCRVWRGRESRSPLPWRVRQATRPSVALDGGCHSLPPSGAGGKATNPPRLTPSGRQQSRQRCHPT